MNTEQANARLLIVDDESGITESLKDYFELEGFSVSTASSGNQAISKLSQEKFDIVISDVRMPDGDGRFLLSEIRKNNPTKPIVILMSGFSDMKIEEVLSKGGYTMLTKPFPPKDLLVVLNDALSSEQK